jgi:hypothetical protein
MAISVRIQTILMILLVTGFILLALLIVYLSSVFRPSTSYISNTQTQEAINWISTVTKSAEELQLNNINYAKTQTQVYWNLTLTPNGEAVAIATSIAIGATATRQSISGTGTARAMAATATATALLGNITSTIAPTASYTFTPKPTAVPSRTPIPNTKTPVPSSTLSPSNTPVPPPTATSIPPTPTSIPPTITPTQISPSNTPLPPTITPTSTPTTQTPFSFTEWSSFARCDEIQNRVRNTSSFVVIVTGKIWAKPDNGDEIQIAEQPPEFQTCPVGCWSGPSERITNYFGNFHGTIKATTWIHYEGNEVGRKDLEQRLDCGS